MELTAATMTWTTVVTQIRMMMTHTDVSSSQLVRLTPMMVWETIVTTTWMVTRVWTLP